MRSKRNPLKFFVSISIKTPWDNLIYGRKEEIGKF